MEKLLAMSILSSTPAEISGSPWMKISLGKKSRKSDAAGGVDNGEIRSDSNKQQQEQKKKAWRPSFAPEFDGLNCFETIIAH